MSEICIGNGTQKRLMNGSEIVRGYLYALIISQNMYFQ